MKKILFLIIFLSAVTRFWSQMGINVVTPSPSAMLHVKSADKGVLFPQLQLVSVTSFAPLSVAPPENTLVFNINPVGTGATKLLRGYYIWKGNKWNSPALNTFSKIMAKYQVETGTSFNFNDSATDKNVGIFNTNIINDDPNVFQAVSSQELRILKSGTYLITTNLGLKNTTASSSQAEIAMAYFYGDTRVSAQVLTMVPQQRTSSVSNKFNYSLIDYVNISDADVGKTLTLKTKKNNVSDNDVITYDPDNFSSVTIVRISDVQ